MCQSRHVMPIWKDVKVDDGCTRSPSALEGFGLQDFLHVALAPPPPIYDSKKKKSKAQNEVGWVLHARYQQQLPSMLYMTRDRHIYYGSFFDVIAPFNFYFLEVFTKVESAHELWMEVFEL